MWRIGVVLGVIAFLVFVALLNLGLMSIPGAGAAVVRYQTQDVSESPSTLQWNFDEVAEGALPDGAAVLSQPRFGNWAVQAEPDAPSPPNALCQTGMAEFPSVALSPNVYADLTMSTRFKPISGVVDQAAGLLFRIQDADNYYILRANALEGNVNFYKYAGGRRSLITEGAATVASGQWQELRVEVVGQHFRGFLNGELVVEASDDAYAAGRPGLWTKADSVTCFDDVRLSTP
jgi:3-keto-disaccharide hydrolase